MLRPDELIEALLFDAGEADSPSQVFRGAPPSHGQEEIRTAA
jgi:hypothetical protein